MIEADVQGSGLTRTNAKTEGSQGGAFLWALDNGYGVFLKADSSGGSSNSISVVNELGTITRSVSALPAVGKNDKRFRVAFEPKGSKSSQLAIYEDRDSNAAVRSESFPNMPGKIGRIRIGSTFAAYPSSSLPSVCKIASRCQWGGVTSPASCEPIDAIRIYDLSIRRENARNASFSGSSESNGEFRDDDRYYYEAR